jgi:hypothetical protein
MNRDCFVKSRYNAILLILRFTILLLMGTFDALPPLKLYSCCFAICKPDVDQFCACRCILYSIKFWVGWAEIGVVGHGFFNIEHYVENL